MKFTMKPLALYLHNVGLIAGAILPEVDKLDAVPEFQRGWYAQDAATGKYKLDYTKVDVEDVTGLKRTVEATREEARRAKAEREEAVRKALEPYQGIDPEKTRALLSKFENEEEAALIAAGKVDEVINRRMAKRDQEIQRQVEEANESAAGALEVAATFMERALDNEVRSAAIKAGLHPSAVEDALFRARAIFDVDDEGNVVQFDEDGETPVLGKDGKTPYSVNEWLETMRKEAPHWFPSGQSGGGAGGDRGSRPGADMSGMTPTQRLTAARQQTK